jgi:dihydroceramidase
MNNSISNKICLKPYWGDPNIPLTFCENKYKNSHFIAEYYNTFSAISYILVGVYFFCKKKSSTLGLITIILGIGTMVMHSTLQKYGQWVDELSMLMITILVQNRLGFFKAIYNLWFYTYITLLLYWTYHSNSLIFASMFILNLLNIGYLLRNNISKNVYLILYVLLMSGSMFCWFIDQVFCDKVNNEYLHAIWHVGTALSMFFGFLTL